MSVILNLCDFWKVPVPEEFNGYTRENYAEKYLENKEQAKQAFIALVMTLGTEVPQNRAMSGDLLIVRYKEEYGIGIYAGNGRVLTAFAEATVRTAPLKMCKIEKVIRICRF